MVAARAAKGNPCPVVPIELGWGMACPRNEVSCVDKGVDKGADKGTDKGADKGADKGVGMGGDTGAAAQVRLRCS